MTSDALRETPAALGGKRERKGKRKEKHVATTQEENHSLVFEASSYNHGLRNEEELNLLPMDQHFVVFFEKIMSALKMRRDVFKMVIIHIDYKNRNNNKRAKRNELPERYLIPSSLCLFPK